MRKKRKPRATLSPEWPYKSKLEERLGKGPMKRAVYEPCWGEVSYVIPKTYKPDFVHAKEPLVLYEAKGRFRTYDEARKYLCMLECNPGITLRFIITNPNQRAYPGVKITMGKWLDKHGIEWCTEADVPKKWRSPE